MKKCSNALRRRVSDYTTTVFNDCICEVFGFKKDDTYNIDDAAATLRGVSAGYYHSEDMFGPIEEFLVKKNKVEILYQEKLKQLSTKQLNEIVKAHQLDNGLRRAPKTIETITSELTRRALFNDSEESESKGNDGDVDELRGPSTKHRKKATSKRRKTSKSRRRNRTN